MDFFNSIKEWLGGLFGDSVSNVAESVNVEEIQQQASDATSQATDAVDNVKNNLPGQQ